MKNGKIKLSRIPTTAPRDLDKDKTKKKTEEFVGRISELQNLLYAEHKSSLLIILQGMDASGKDGVVKKVFQGVNPQGCQVKSFKAPTEEELAHDFLWRIHKYTPEKGMIQIFNRSHYEDVLITRVHEWIDDKTAKKRFEQINAFEQTLQERGTHVLKFYLHISREEQAKRFEDRLSDPMKRWKYNANDLAEAKKWKEYWKAYEDVFRNCSPEIPWIIIPADQNWYKEHLIAESIVKTLDRLKMKYPEANL